MANYSDFDWGQQEEQQPTSGLFNDFDWSEEAAPTNGAAPAQVSQETVKDVTKGPVGRPAGPQEASSEKPKGTPEEQQVPQTPASVAVCLRKLKPQTNYS